MTIIKNRYIKTLLFGGMIWYLGEGMLGPLLAIFTQRIGGDLLDISWAYAIYLTISGFLFILVGKIGDVYKNKEVLMIFGYFLNTIFTFSYIFVQTPGQLFLVQAGLGIALAFATPTWNSLYAKHENRGSDGFEWGLAGGTAQIVTGLGIIAGGLIVTFWSFNILFIIMGTIQLIATIYQAQILIVKERK